MFPTSLKFSLIACLSFSMTGCMAMMGGAGCGPVSDCVGDIPDYKGPMAGFATSVHQRQLQRRQRCGCRSARSYAFSPAAPGVCGDCGEEYYGSSMAGMISDGMAYDGMSYGGMAPQGHCSTCQNEGGSPSYPMAPMAPVPHEMNYHPVPNAPVPPVHSPMGSPSPTPAAPMGPMDPAASGEYFAPPVTDPKTGMMIGPGMQYPMSGYPMMGAPMMHGQPVMQGQMMGMPMQAQMMAPQMQMMPHQMQMSPSMPTYQMAPYQDQSAIHQTQYAPGAMPGMTVSADTPPAIQAF